MIFNSAREEESNGESILSQRASDDLDEVRNHLFIIALVESIYDNDRRSNSWIHRPNRFCDQLSELAFERPMGYMMVAPQNTFDV
jgi:hypothetical protein